MKAMLDRLLADAVDPQHLLPARPLAAYAMQSLLPAFAFAGPL